MVKAIIELSKYIFVLNLYLYVIISFVVLRTDDEQRKSAPFFIQYACIFINHIVGSFVFLSVYQDITYFFFPLIQIIILFAFLILMRAFYPYSNRLLSSHIVLLLSIGFLVLTRLSLSKSIKQFVIVSCALLLALIVPAIMKHIELVYKCKWIYCVINLSILLLVLVSGNLVNGSKLSFSIYGISFQPSEFVKILYVLFLAIMLADRKNFKALVLTAALAAVHVLFLVCSKDLGSALIFFTVFVFMVYVATTHKRYLFVGAVTGVLASVASYFLFSHVRVRVSAWLDPWSDITAKGYQVAQSLFAIGTGNWFGLGLASGTPSTIPYVEQDFIFSAICEEFGVLFGIGIIAVCVNLFLEIVHIAKDCEESFVKYSAFGIGMLYISQIFLTIGGNTKFIPLTGVTLPLISYGGSSCLASLLMFSIVQGLFLNYNAYLKDEEPIHRNIQMNTVAICYSIVFVAMAGYLVRFILVDSNTVVNNAYNATRQEIVAAKTIRGDIVAADGTVLATTETTEDEETRVYPFGSYFSHVIGYASNGKMGIEKNANMYLVSSNISLNDKLADDIADEKHMGNTVYTTFNVDLQKAAYDALGVYDGAVVVTEPSTGKILAMVSKPDFDPNEIEAQWDTLIKKEGSSVLVNRATQGLYPPGSTFKIFTALEYMREHPTTYQYYQFTCTGRFTYGEDKIQCYHGTQHGTVDFLTSFAKSCNSSFANIGMQLDRTSFAETLEELYFNKDWNTQFSIKQSKVTMSEACSDSSVMQTSIGQGATQITPIHIAMVTGAIANGGTLMTPYMIEHIETSTGKVIKQYSPKEIGQVMTEEEADALTQMMIAVVKEGTGTRLKGQNYQAAGKTGSAEFNTKGDSHAWFTGFTYDTENPIQITVIMEDAGSGGEFAVPVARRILDAYYN